MSLSAPSTYFRFSLLWSTALGLVLSATAWGATDFSPSWVSHGGAEMWDSPNNSLLNNYDRVPEYNPLAFLFDAHGADELRQKYEAVDKQYNFRNSYGLADAYEQQSFVNAISGMQSETIQKVESHQGQLAEGQARGIIEKNQDLKPLVAPVAVVGVGAAIYRGSGVNIKVTDDTKFRAKASVRDRTGGLEFHSPYIHGNLDVHITSPLTLDPTMGAPPLEPASRDEHYRLSLSRSLPFDISSGVSYGSTTSTMSASLSRPIMPNLTAVLGAAKTTNPNLEVLSPSEQSLRFLYGVRF